MQADNAPAQIDLLIQDAFVITMDDDRRVLRSGFVAVDAGQIVGVGPMSECSFSATRTVSDSAMIVLPGIVNAHDHLAQSLFRGSLDEAGPSSARRGGLFYHSMALTAERAEAAARLTLLELTRYGVTTTHDSHFTHAHKDSIDGVLRALAESHLRGVVARAANDTDALPEVYRETIDEALGELERLEKVWNSDTITVIPEAVGTLRNTPEMIEALYQRAVERDTIWHMHLAQNFGEREATVEKYGCGAVEFLDRLGVLDDRLLAAHCVGITLDEAKLLGAAGARIAHCPLANLYRGSAIAPVMELIEAGAAVAVGVDGAGTNNGQNPWEMAKIAVYMQKHRFGDYAIGSAELGLEWITINAARALGVEDRVGSIEPGKDADLLLIDRSDPALVPGELLPSHLIYAFDPRAVREVIIRGETVFRNGQHLLFDSDRVVAEAEAARRGMLDELGDPEPRRSPWTFVD
ncbi:amidohydrolase [soil metagenome]